MNKFCLLFLFAFIQKTDAQTGLTNLLESAQVKLGGGDPYALHAAADRLIGSFPNDYNGYALKGIAWLQQNNLVDGERLIRESIAKKNRDPYRGAIEMLNEYSNFFTDAGQPVYRALLADCTEKWNPEGWEGWALRAYHTAFEAGASEEAVGYFRKARAVAKLPEEKVAAETSLIAFLVDAQKLDEAREVAAGISLDRVKTLEQLALLTEAFKSLGEKKRTAEVYEKILTIKTDWMEIYEALVKVYAELGLLEEKCHTYYRWMTVGEGRPAVAADCLHPAKMLAAKPGQTLVFKVTTEAVEYPFEVKINEFSSESMAFDWKMGATTISTGSVRMDKTALEKAVGLVSNFNNGENLLLTDRTAVWLSRLVFSGLANPTGVIIDFGKGPETFTDTKPSLAHFWFENRYAILPMLRSHSAKSSQIDLLNNVNNPLITRFKSNDFEVKLVEIK